MSWPGSCKRGSSRRSANANMDLSPEKIFVVGVIALMVLGPERLPHVARTAGRMLAEVRRVSASVQHEVTNAIAEPRELLGQAAGENGFEDIRKALLAAPLSWRSALGEMVGGPTGHARPSPVPRPAPTSRWLRLPPWRLRPRRRLWALWNKLRAPWPLPTTCRSTSGANR